MIPNCTAQKLITALPLNWNRAFTWAVAHDVIFRYCLNILGSFFGHVTTASSPSRVSYDISVSHILTHKLASVCTCNLPYSAPYIRLDHLIRKFEFHIIRSLIYFHNNLLSVIWLCLGLNYLPLKEKTKRDNNKTCSVRIT